MKLERCLDSKCLASGGRGMAQLGSHEEEDAAIDAGTYSFKAIGGNSIPISLRVWAFCACAARAKSFECMQSLE